MLNRFVGMGRLTRDPELRRTSSGIAVASFTMAVDRDFASKDGGERETDFIDCVAWRQTGEFVSKYFTKGRMAVVSGRLQMRSYNDKEGNRRTAAEIVADNVYFGSSKRDEGTAPSAYSPQGGQNMGGGYSSAPAAKSGYYTAPAVPGIGGAPGSDFAMLEDDDAQLPF